ncbi:hypothetical protein N182_05550 [Sinorhizobium sp. GL2]|nr:hypothetical protein N182_05550 [Sinorhizobium sp. GL2]
MAVPMGTAKGEGVGSGMADNDLTGKAPGGRGVLPTRETPGRLATGDVGSKAGIRRPSRVAGIFSHQVVRPPFRRPARA